VLETLHAVALVFSTQGAPAAYTHPPSVAQSPATPVPAPGNICVISRPKSRGNYTGFGLHIYCPEKVPPVQATLAAQSLLSLASVPVHVATPSLAPVQLEPQAICQRKGLEITRKRGLPVYLRRQHSGSVNTSNLSKSPPKSQATADCLVRLRSAAARCRDCVRGSHARSRERL